jgi:hypothetical protein
MTEEREMPVNGRVTPLALRLGILGASVGRGLSLVLIFAWTRRKSSVVISVIKRFPKRSDQRRP